MLKVSLAMTILFLQRGFAFTPVARPAFRMVHRAATLETSATDSDFADFKSSKSFFFPGQGAQVVGMAKKVVDEVRKLN